MTNSPRYSADDLASYAVALLEAAGLAHERARAVAEILVEGDLLGHTTHGLQLLGQYLKEIDGGSMTLEGEPEVIREHGGALTWDGRRLPGPWLVLKAMDWAMAKARGYGTASVAIRRSHHIAALASFLKRATDRNMMMLLLSSDANSASVAPFGGTEAVFTPNPIAAGIPTEGRPILIDISASLVTNALTNRLHREGAKLPYPWLMDNQGAATTDPAVMFSEPKGSILPVGGLEAGHKGYGLALIVEILTAGLAGFGRADPKQGWGATVFLQILDPAAFGGVAAFTRQTEWIAAACRRNPPRPGFDRVRLPGERGLDLRDRQLKEGVQLHPGIMESLAHWSEKLGVPPPLAR
jgi:LDH2 family malate/lactate/ureidoglycolate dehydrogenase